jgi:predicted nucleic acid-binding Zn ribbon protein
MGGRHAPRQAGSAIAALTARLAPQTTLGDVQRVWPQSAGELIAQEATPTAERGGVLTITCRAAVWASELDLMSVELIGRINASLGAERISKLRCVAAPPRSWAAAGEDDDRG